MNFVALRMLTGDRAKYFGLVFAIAFCTFLLENQTSIFANIMVRTGSLILDVTDAEVWVMDPKTEYFDQTKALKDTDLTRVRGVPGVKWAVRLFKGNPVARTSSGRFALIGGGEPFTRRGRVGSTALIKAPRSKARTRRRFRARISSTERFVRANPRSVDTPGGRCFHTRPTAGRGSRGNLP